jgi:putative ABC transport system permease protein
MGIPLVKGREFEWSDTSAAPPVLLVNEKFVEEYLQGREPLGGSVRIGKVWRTIAGVHRNYVYRQPDAGHEPTVFLPLAQDYDPRPVLVLRTRGEPGLAAASVREVFQQLDRNLPLDRVMTMEENVSIRFADTRAVTGVLGIFGFVACTLAAIGLYGVLATFVNQRRREFGVRTALGATPGDLRRLVLARGARLTVIGCILGIFLSAAFARVLESAVWQLRPSGLGIYLLAGCGVALMAVVSTFLPSRRAARLDPLVALRYE